MSDKEMLLDRILEKIDSSGDCWNWTSTKNKDGYGKLKHLSKMVLAHRFIWEHFNGKIESKMCVLHKCDNPACVNPNHLLLGTQRQNMIDRDNKKRNSSGEKHGSSKLTQFQVEEIRLLYKRGVKGEFSLKGLSKKFGVSGSQISLIVNNKNWRRSA